MKSEDIVTVGDLIQFLIELDPNKEIYIYDDEWGTENPLQYIDVEDNRIVIYD